MGLFKKKKKEEVINININDNLETQDIQIDNMTERVEKMKEDLNMNVINKKYNLINKNNNIIIHDYYMCKIYGLASLDKTEYDLEIKDLEQGINAVNEKYDLLTKRLETIKNFGEENVVPYYDELNELLENLLGLQRNVLESIKDLSNTFYGKLSISTVNVCLDKSNEELADVSRNVFNKLGNDTLERCAEELYYHSGEMVYNFVREVVNVVKRSGNKEYIDKYTCEYFLNGDYIIALDEREWINLYNKVKYVLKMINTSHVDLYLKMNERFNDFEVVYLIIMLYGEKKAVKK